MGGKKYIDIRQFTRNKERDLIPTKIGVRLDTDAMTTLKLDLRNFISIASRLAEKSSKIFRWTQVVLGEKKIQAAKTERNNCYGCEVNHPLQVQHMGNGGCLEPFDWKDLVGLYFDEAKGGIEIATVTRIVTETSKRLGEKTLFVDGLKKYSDEEVSKKNINISL